MPCNQELDVLLREPWNKPRSAFRPQYVERVVGNDDATVNARMCRNDPIEPFPFHYGQARGRGVRKKYQQVPLNGVSPVRRNQIFQTQ
jgi:hypothetical protein